MHVSGEVSCKYSKGYSRWGCPLFSDRVLTAITNANDQVIAPQGTHHHGQYHIEGVNHDRDDTLTLFTNSNEEVEKGQEFRVWYTEDLFNYYTVDNAGTHCILVLVKYC